MRVAIFGENLNDTRALKELVLGLRPELEPGDVRVIRSPPTLVRGSGIGAVRGWAAKANAALKGARAAGAEFDAVMAHTDADGADDGAFAQARTAELKSAGVDNAVAVVPVQAMESWWLLFPGPTETVVVSWRGALSRSAFNTDAVSDPKSELIRRTRVKQPKRPYAENDSPAVAQAIRRSNFTSNGKANSPSFERFRAIVATL